MDSQDDNFEVDETQQTTQPGSTEAHATPQNQIEFVVTDPTGTTLSISLSIQHSLADLKRRINNSVSRSLKVVEYLGLPEADDGSSDEDVLLLQLPLDNPHSILLICEDRPDPIQRYAQAAGANTETRDVLTEHIRRMQQAASENFYQLLDQMDGDIPIVNDSPLPPRHNPASSRGLWHEKMSEVLNLSAHGTDFFEYMQSTGIVSFPVPFPGAFQDILIQSKESLKMVVVLLHDPSSAASVDYCRDAMGADGNIELLENMFLFWASAVDETVSDVLNEVFPDKTYPLTVIFAPTSSQFSVVQIVEGKVSSEELFSNLCQAIETQEPVFDQERTRRQNAEQEKQLRDQQEEEYQRHLREDMLMFKEQEEKERLQKEQELEAVRLAEEKKSRRELKRMRILDEPQAGQPSILLSIKFPNGSNQRRKFPANATMQDLFDYVEVTGDIESSFRLVTTHPRKVYDLAEVSNQTLSQAGIANMMSIHVQQENA